MKVLRSNKDSVMAMLEAFVHDPLINWRLLNTNDATPDIVSARDSESKEGLNHEVDTSNHLASRVFWGFLSCMQDLKIMALNSHDSELTLNMTMMCVPSICSGKICIQHVNRESPH